jgi:SAM-dependent methyltransferase
MQGVVRAHYDAQAIAAAGGGGRTRRPDYNACLHNNALKAQLIARHLLRARVLDIACGKGGDILKFRPEMCAEYVGVDISPVCIEEARSRARRDARFTFHVADVGLEAMRCASAGASPAFAAPASFDAVSCMFALHYFFANEAMLDAVVSLVASSLKAGGRFFGVMTDECAVRLGAVEAILAGDGASFGNSLFRVQVGVDVRRAALTKQPTHCGASIRFTMAGGGFDCTEYCAPLSALIKSCMKAGLVHASSENLLKIKLDPEFKQVTGAQPLNAEEAQLVGMYASFLFIKKT